MSLDIETMLSATATRSTRRSRRQLENRSWSRHRVRTRTQGVRPLGTMRALGDGISRDPIGEEGGINPFGFVDGNPIARYDWLGLYTCADLEAIMSKARQRYREAVLSEVDGNDFLREIGWADFGVHASLTTSKAASATAFVMAGSPLVGFTGIGRSACVVGRVPATLNVSTTAGPVAIGEGYAATVGTGISQMAVTVPLMVARVPAAKYSSKTLQEKAEAALEQIATAQAVQQQTWALYKTAKLLHELGCTMRCICR